VIYQHLHQSFRIFSIATMDDLLALLTEDPSLEAVPLPSEDPTSPEAAVAASADDKVGIRMINRRISGSDLLDLIEDDFPYHAAASIAAMSTAALNRLLQNPAEAVLDRAATVCGLTNLITVSIVLSNSGTRVASSSGNAYCLLTLGSLHTGPALSVMLFGSVYSQFCRVCTPGTVVALVCPRLMPNRDGDNKSNNFATTVLFSAQNDEQLRVVAQARDFGTCQAKSFVKISNSSGGQSTVAKPCKNVIDKREGEYCAMHRRATKNGTSTKSTMSKLAAEHLPRPKTSTIQTGDGKTMILPSHLQANNKIVGKVGQHLHERPSTSKSNNIIPVNRRVNSILHPKNSKSQSKAILIRDLPSSINASTHSQSANIITNPYAKGPPNCKPSLSLVTKKQAAPTKPTRTQPSVPVTENWLHLAQGRGNNENKKPQSNPSKRKRINTDTRAHDGTVLVPKSTGIMNRNHASLSHTLLSATRPNLPQPKEKSAEDVLLRQQVVAEQLKQKQQQPRLQVNRETSHTVALQDSKPYNSHQALLFDAIRLDSSQLEEVAAAKSKYQDVLDAEEYVQRRNKLQTLDELEHKAMKRHENSTKSGQGLIEKEWHCATCKHTFKSPPVLCQRRSHVVKIRRNIQETKTVDEQRQALSNQKDGMILGHGLEWSGPPR
jgi:hypothetical protein